MSEAPLVMKWFTRVRKIPTLIGKMPSGERIKGGPYKAAQLVAFGSVLVASLWSMKWWARLPFYASGTDGQVYAYVTALACAVGAGLLAKRVAPSEGQSAIAAGSGSVRLLTTSSAPQFAGRSAAARPSRRTARRVRVTLTDLPTDAPEVMAQDLPEPSELANSAASVAPRPLTSAQLKLAGLHAQRTSPSGVRS